MIRGETITDMSTYISVPKHDGTLRADGNGVLTVTSSGEMATYTFQAIGRTSPNGGLEARGALIISSMPNGKLSFLNNTVGVFKTEIDSMGNTHTRTWSIDPDRIGK